MELTMLSTQDNNLLNSQSASLMRTFQSIKNEARASHIVQDYDAISLSEMDGVALLRRMDTKYVLRIEQLFQALSSLRDDYYVLQVDGRRISNYHNIYFDTPEYDLYYQHHNERSNRYKVRSRQYVNSGIAFLEVKRKNNRGQTIKNRMQTTDGLGSFSGGQQSFLLRHYPDNSRLLHPVLTNDFMRITLVSKQSVERLTLDINLQLSKAWNQISFPMLAVAEVKQEHFSLESDFIQQMRAMNIAPQRFSKYCLGITKLYPRIKQNRFKPRNLMIERIMHQGVNYGYVA